jgi:phosphatidate cytidylyltransferase
MSAFFCGLVLLDGWLDGSMTTAAYNKDLQGTLLCVLIALLMVPAQLELSKLATVRNTKIFTVVSTVGAVALATSWYWPQLEIFPISQGVYLSLVFALLLFAVLLNQYGKYGTCNVVGNCGASCFSAVYLGLLSSFVLGIRIKYGLWPLLMLICVVKSADIGAYAIGSMIGKHKFSPRISPGKTWEGMGGAVAAGVAVAVIFAVTCDIMTWWFAVIFGFYFAFIGQMGDLAESMIKRDAEQKDSAKRVPGFGGILDIIDSPLVAAPFAYVFFMFA